MRGRATAAIALLAATAVAGCTSIGAALNPSGQTAAAAASTAASANTLSLAPGGQTALADPQQPALAPQPNANAAAPAQSAALIASARVEFAPIVGVTVKSAAPLSQELMRRARERGLALVTGKDPAVTNIVKGYFSAFSEGKTTTIVYVWDVLDKSGNRLHRIEGQEKATGGNGWDSVPDAVMQKIADETVDQLAAYLGAAKA